MHIEFISDSENLCEQFTKLCEQYECFEWAVAWASDPEQDEFSIGGTLLQYRKKIKRLVVGCHFYQTSPEFIKIFINSKQVKFLTQTDGTFHPKVYLFYNRDGKWAAIMGSSNFTCAGFTKNSEANILLTGNKDNHVRDAISSYISKQWKNADSFNEKDLKKYKDAYEKKKPIREKLSRGKTKPVVIRETKNWAIEKIQKTTPWDKYEKELKEDKKRFKSGIKQLKEAYRLFSKCQFNKLTDDERKYLAGTIGKNKRLAIRETSGIDWYMFGTLNQGRMRTHIINNNKKINDALEAIPLKGTITKAMYQKYLNKLRSIEGLGVGPAVCSRLLTMKRPDFFMSLNGPSIPVISKKYRIPESRLQDADTYWDLIMKIHEDDWYRHPKNTEAKPYRMALMDCLIREWK